jgi:hypothetical protein
LWLDRFDAYLRWQAARPAIHVIHIVRKDPVEWLKSKYLADKSRSFKGREYPEDIMVEVPIREALRRLATKRWIDSCLSQLSRSNPYICVSYEDFLESDRTIVFKLMKFLDCDVGKLREFDYRKQTKQSKRSACDYITNYQQLVAALEDIDWSRPD